MTDEQLFSAIRALGYTTRAQTWAIVDLVSDMAQRRPKLMPGHLIEAHMAVIGGNKDHIAGTSNWAYSMLRELGKLVDEDSKEQGNA